MPPEVSSKPWVTRRAAVQRILLSWFALPGSLIVALLLGAIMMWALGSNPITGYKAMFNGAFNGNYAITSSAVRAAPLLLVAVGICISFRASMLNIGGEGQLAMGGLASAAVALVLGNSLPSAVLIPIVLIAGAVGGAIWGAIPGAFKAYFNVNEILSTIMLNLVAVQLMNYLLSGPMVDTTQNSTYGLIPETRLLPSHSWLPILIPGTQFHLGVVIAVVVAGAAYVLLWHTGLGFRLRAVGLSREAARYAGIKVKQTQVLAMTLSGAMCGLGGALLVFGSIAHRMVTDGSLTGFTGSDGFNGIVVALFGALSPLWSIVSSFLFGGLLTGGDSLQVVTGLPPDVVTALEGLVVVFVVSLEYMRRRARIVSLAPISSASPSASSDEVRPVTPAGPPAPPVSGAPPVPATSHSTAVTTEKGGRP